MANPLSLVRTKPAQTSESTTVTTNVQVGRRSGRVCFFFFVCLVLFFFRDIMHLKSKVGLVFLTETQLENSV